ncbi:MAG: SgcJ/EcaC family oxidoreductase [Thermoanaerobaculia bacterium]
MRRAGLFTLLFCLAFAAGPATAAGGAKDLDTAFTKAMIAGDAAAVAACYADDAVLVMPGSAAIKGKKAITEALEGFLKDLRVTDLVISDAHYRTAGHLSTGWGHYRMTTVPKAGGSATTEVGTFCEVASEKDGVWKYISDHAATDPPPTAAAAPKK